MSHLEATVLPGRRPARSFGALRHRDYRAYFGVGVVAMMADNVEHVIAYWMIFQKFHSPSLAGFAVISHWLPSLLFSVQAGSLADRYDCRRLIQISQGLFMLASLSWGFLFLNDALQVWHAVAILLLHGFASALSTPAQQLIIHDIVGSEHLESAVRLNASSRNLATLLGPAVGGGLMFVLGPGWGIVVNVLSYLPLIVVLAFLPYRGHPERTASRRPAGLGFREVAKAFHEARRNRSILLMVLLGGVTSLFVGNAFQAQMPEYAHNLGADNTGLDYSALLAANAAGAVIGVVLLESAEFLRAGARAAIVCSMTWSVLIGLFPVAPTYGIALALLFCAGFFNIAFVAMAQTLVQLLAPPAARGRVVGLFAMANLGLRVGSGFTVGVFGSVVGIYWSLGLSAAAVFVIALGLLAADLIGHRVKVLAAGS